VCVRVCACVRVCMCDGYNRDNVCDGSGLDKITHIYLYLYLYLYLGAQRGLYACRSIECDGSCLDEMTYNLMTRGLFRA